MFYAPLKIESSQFCDGETVRVLRKKCHLFLENKLINFLTIGYASTSHSIGLNYTLTDESLRKFEQFGFPAKD